MCLVVTLLYASVATVVVVYDCRQKLRVARLKDAEREASLARTAASLSSRTAASSAMKRQAVSGPDVRPRGAASGPASDRQTAVKFTDHSPPTNDISC